ncbi:MAG: helix-hairpin-helix domain-containing protein [Bacteroidales bacterium]|nr:helix-hairpin-helix domain-containing protein [Bacteroidales bacterium]
MPNESAIHDLDSLLMMREAALKELQTKENERATQVNELHPFPFNPNTMTEEEGLRMGLSDRQVRNVINYRESGGHFYSKKDMGKLYTISDSDFEQLEPFIVLPIASRETRMSREQAMSKETKNGTESEKTVKREIPIVDLNVVDSATLVELPQIGSYTAGRIVSYREKLGGFISLEQLREVKGIDSARYEAIFPYLRLENAEIHLLDINRSDFKTLVNHPYLSYNQVKAIVNHREKKGMVKNWAQLQTVVGEKEPINPLIERYLKY